MRFDFETWSINRWDLDEVQCIKMFDLDPNLLSQGQVLKKVQTITLLFGLESL